MFQLRSWMVFVGLAGPISSPALAQCNPVPDEVLTSADPDDGDYFGGAIALEGNRLLVGAGNDDEQGQDGGAAYVFERPPGGAWQLVTKLLPNDAQPFKSFGSSVALHGDTAVVGALCDDEAGSCAGAAYVFEHNQGGANAWGQSQKLISSSALSGDFAGRVAVSATTLLVGASGRGSSALDYGVVFHYERAGLTEPWMEQVPITPPDPSTAGWFGYQVELEGEVAAIGARADDEAAPDAGAVHVYRRDAGTGNWAHEAKLLPSDPPITNGSFGEAVALSGDTIVVGSPSHAKAYTFDRDPIGGTWSESHIFKPANPPANPVFGVAVDLDGDVLVVGANNWNDPSASGRAFVFERGPSGWYETATIEAPGKLADERFGDALAIQGTEAVVGAPGSPIADLLPGRVITFQALAAEDPETYCTAGTSLGGCQSVITGDGFAHLSQPSGMSISVQLVDGQRSGIIFWGNAPTVLPWGVGGTSWRCVQAPVVRTPLQQSGGTTGLCDGALSLDFNAWMSANPAKAPPAGSTAYVQGWYRDPGAPKNSSLSDGLKLAICP